MSKKKRWKRRKKPTTWEEWLKDNPEPEEKYATKQMRKWRPGCGRNRPKPS